MKMIVASDIHGYETCCVKLIEAFKRERAERILLLGDLIDGNQKVADILNVISDSVLCVRGNCDHESDQEMLDFPIMAYYCLLFVGGKVIFATHGHKYGMSNPPKADILLQGHTHVPMWTKFNGGMIYANPGSVSFPRDGSKRGYITLQEWGMQWKTLDGEIFDELRFSCNS